MNKNRQIISELKDFFKHNDSSKAVNAVSNVMDKLVIQAKTVGPVKNPNCKFTFVQLVKLLVLFPLFSVKTASDYADCKLPPKSEQFCHRKVEQLEIVCKGIHFSGFCFIFRSFIHFSVALIL